MISLADVATEALNTYQNLDEEITVVFMHPRARYRQQLLSPSLADTKRRLIYYKRKGTLPFEVYLSGLEDELSAQFDETDIPSLSAADPVSAAENLLSFLSHHEPFALVLDEVENEGDVHFDTFLRTLSLKIPTGSRLIINGRYMPNLPWLDLVSDGKAAIIGQPGEALQEDATTEVDPCSYPADLDVSAFGPGTAFVRGHLVDEWGGDLPRNLFFYLVDRGGATRQEIFDIFWPNLSPRDATNVFHVTKHKLIEMIGIDVIEFRLGRYYLNAEIPMRYDIACFEELLRQADWQDNDEDLLQSAVDLCRAPFLIGTNLSWVHGRREELRRKYGEALGRLGLIRQRQGKKEQALGYLLRAVIETPLREDIHREILRLYTELGNVEAAKTHYAYLEGLLNEELSISPAPETADLYHNLTNNGS
jgi:DNA-binding SARP family transcriptional activator